MSSTNLGKVRIVPKGTWANTNAYNFLDTVFDNATGASYLAVQDVPVSTAISNTAYWQKLCNGFSSTDVTNAVNAWLVAHPEATTTVEDGAITLAKLNSDIHDNVESIPTLINGTGIMVEEGYFNNSYKAVSEHAVGTKLYYNYDSAKNEFVFNYVGTATGSQGVGCGMADSGISAADLLVPIADYPVAIIHVDTNVPAAASLHFRVFLYKSDGTTLNHNYDVAIPTGSSDHVINDVDAFADTINCAFEKAESGDYLVTIGITPTFPSTGFGYIKRGEEQKLESGECFKVERFYEKPNLERAISYIESGCFSWNSSNHGPFSSTLPIYHPK